LAATCQRQCLGDEFACLVTSAIRDIITSIDIHQNVEKHIKPIIEFQQDFQNPSEVKKQSEKNSQKKTVRKKILTTRNVRTMKFMQLDQLLSFSIGTGGRPTLENTITHSKLWSISLM